MFTFLLVLTTLCFTSIQAILETPENERIIGGSLATITTYPYAAVVLYASNSVTFRQTCGGTLINNRSILSAIFCWFSDSKYPSKYRVRLGSVNATTGGLQFNVGRILSHPNYNSWNQNNNIGLLRLSSSVTLTTTIRPARIAGANYNLGDHESLGINVWAIGWGRTTASSVNSEQLRHAQIVTVKHSRCQDIYGVSFVTANMICAGWTAAGRGSCLGDQGSPLIHGNVVVGITSFIIGCGDLDFPPVYTRISQYTKWIQANA